MKKEAIILSNERFSTIYTNESFRNAVAFAHKCCDKHSCFLHYKALDYPNEYIVTTEQIEAAKAEYARAKAEKVANLQKGALIFVCMGGDREIKSDDEINNYRVRTEFKNSEGRHFFVEFSYFDKQDSFICDYSIDRDLENEYSEKLEEFLNKRNALRLYSAEWKEVNKVCEKYWGQPYYNYGGIQHKSYTERFTKGNILKIINETFGCDYTSVELDEHTLRTEDFICFCK